MNNYLAAEQPIIDRLKAQVADFRVVLPYIDLVATDETGHSSPACFVRYLRDELENPNEGSGRMQFIRQHWEIIVCVRNVREAMSQDVRVSAGDLLRQTNIALTGYRPTVEHGMLIRTDVNRETYYSKAGYGAFFLRYATRFDLEIDYTNVT